MVCSKSEAILTGRCLVTNDIATLLAEMFGGTEFWLYTIIIIKIESHPF